MEKVKSGRIYQYDVIRIVAAISVVAIHSFFSLLLLAPVGSKSWWLGNLITSSLRWAVPVFIMLSGALIVRPQLLKPETLAHFYKNKVAKTLIPLAAFSLLYALWYAKFESPLPLRLDMLHALKQFVLGSPLPGHLYFLYIIFGLYVLSPFINHIVAALNVRQVTYVAVIALAYSALSLTISTWVGGATRSNILFDSALPYTGYFLLGYVVHMQRDRVNATSLRLSLIPLASAWLIIAIGTYGLAVMQASQSPAYFYEYTNPAVAVLSVAIFIAMYQTAGRLLVTAQPKAIRIVSVLSNATFGVYLIHILFMSICAGLLPTVNPVVNSLRTFVVVTIASFCTVMVYQGQRGRLRTMVKAVKKYGYAQPQQPATLSEAFETQS